MQEVADEKAAALKAHYVEKVSELPPKNWQGKFMRLKNVNFAAYGMCLATTVVFLHDCLDVPGNLPDVPDTCPCVPGNCPDVLGTEWH